MIAIQMLFPRSPRNVRDDVRDDDRARSFDHARLPWRDQADVALSSAAVPRPTGSSLMPLCRAPRRPDLASGVGVRLLKPNQSTQSNQINQYRTDVQPTQTNHICRRGGTGAWRSEIKEEPAALGRCGGHSRSYATVPPRLVQPSSEVFGLLTLTTISESGASSARSVC